MGVTALTKHMGPQKHGQAETSGLLASWVRPTSHGSGAAETLPEESNQSMHEEPSDSNQENQNTDNPGPSNSSKTKDIGTPNQWVSDESVLKAEILWILHCSVNHLSYRSNTHTSAIFSTIFSF